MSETSVVRFNCKKCKKLNFPYGQNKRTLPYSAIVTCSFCGYQMTGTWLDTKLNEEIIRKEAGLLPEHDNKSDPRIDVLVQKIEALEAGRDADRKDLQLLRQAIDLIIKQEIQKLKEDASDHNFNLNGIHERVTNVEENIEHAKKYGKFKPDE